MRALILCAALAIPFPVLAQPVPAPEPFTASAPGAIHYSAPEAIHYVDESGNELLPAPIEDGKEIETVVSSVREIRQLANDGLWGPFASALISLILLIFSTLIYRLKAFRAWLKPHQGEIAFILPVLGSLAYSFQGISSGSGFGPWGAAIWTGVQVGGTSVAFYEVVFKRWLKPLALRIWKFVKARLGKKDPK